MVNGEAMLAQYAKDLGIPADEAKKGALYMNTEANLTEAQNANVPDRRRHARYRFSAPITVHAPNQPAMRGMSIEKARFPYG